MRQPHVIAITFLSLVAGSLAGAAGDARPAASQATTLTIYSGREERLVKPLYDRFTRLSGIRLRVRYGDSAELAATIGEEGRNSPADVFFAQDPGSLGGKVLRMTPDGSPAPGADSLVFSLGHRNVQGLAFDDAGRLYAVEFGQNRFDEVNQVVEGSNGGWPEVEGAGDGDGRFLAPITTWETAEASPSGAAVVGAGLDDAPGGVLAGLLLAMQGGAAVLTVAFPQLVPQRPSRA